MELGFDFRPQTQQRFKETEESILIVENDE
jgi:hypothetical protein